MTLGMSFCLGLSAFSAQAEEITGSIDYLVLQGPSYRAGMFSIFNSVIGFLNAYENGEIAGLEVKFGTRGNYYEPSHGPNWWNYYCEPLCVGRDKKLLVNQGKQADWSRMAYHTEKQLTPRQVNKLFKKYIKIKDFVTSDVNRFAQKNFGTQYVIGVHYRGTDKDYEAPKVSYRKVFKEIKNHLEGLKDREYMIFVATDEQGFLDHIKEVFPDRVVALNAIRSTDGRPVHKTTDSPFLHGKQALTDALLLSKCNILIRTSSNLSLWATYFNPKMPVILMNDRK